MLFLLLTIGCARDKPSDTDPNMDTNTVTTSTDSEDTGTITDTDTGPCEAFTIYYDGDGDGYGDVDVTDEACTVLDGWSDNSDDCDDADSSIWVDCPEHDCVLTAEAQHLGESDTGDTGSTVVGTSFYWVCEVNLGWQESRQYCYDHLGADLIAFERPEELEVFQILSNKLLDKQDFWVGVSQATTSPSEDFGWSWVNAQGAVEDEDISEGGVWHIGEPNNGGYAENSGGDEEEDVGAWVRNAGTWAIMDVRVDQDMWPICEVQKTGG